MSDVLKNAGRLDWLDWTKGVGILLVVAGHVLSASQSELARTCARFIYLFHMPLFFLIAGYTLKRDRVFPFVIRKATTLLVPYVLFMALVGVPALAASCSFGPLPSFGIGRCATLPFRLLAGGTSIGGIFSVFWFIPCLFLALCLAQLVLQYEKSVSRMNMGGFFLLSYCAAYLLPVAIPGTTSVLSLGVVPMAFLYVMIGYTWGQQAYAPVRLSFLWRAGTILSVVAFFFLPLSFDMKYGRYGIPVLGLLVSLALSGSILEFARKFEQIGARAQSFVFSAFVFVGKRSLVVMYLHQIVHLGLRQAGVPNTIVLVCVSVILPLAFNRPVTALISRLTTYWENLLRAQEGKI